ncbi:2'-5'-oligoadenylate synthase 1-like [Ahaetulla prasina]|uniref:2'-5'-oligoadenylate synthase 1-like n=1 Tax=Ahaetulla prasina TaxID=499056 RepID=UPI002647543D|nr:2'-5'-oligoadenylate synthase 1-like [Ahaetulla prasina]XP_058024217.1 2'-5'-oligoadenylate synthase 1-like [Ahaetulla prasina]XP_058024218.1 2'-5'-oligoadenylate synthase 1-like [Ahaetulla prasina]XP_058024219.1 2'-5'-oligoadenylate synthase 1-like [Ahaetulla prasina]
MEYQTERMKLYSTPSKRLDEYIGTNLHPSREFQDNVCDAVNRICSFLREKCDLYMDASVIKTIKAGSTGKGTTLDTSSDVDLVIFLSCFSNFQDQVEKRECVIKDIEKNLNRCIQTIAFKVDVFPPRKKGTRSLQLHIQAKKKTELIEVDILPAYDALGQITFTYVPPLKVYIELIEANGQPGEFNTSFTELQRNFVKRCPAKLKDLLRLVKHWYKEIKKQSSTSSKFPPKFALELLTIYAWEEAEGGEQFNTAEGFCTVMKLITRYQDLCLFWTKYYPLDNSKVGLHVKGKLRESRPVIIDPADPTANVAKANSGAWGLLAQKASDCLRQPCCMKDEQPIKPWNVQPTRDIKVTVKHHTGTSAIISCSPFESIKWVKEKFGKEGLICELYLEETVQENIALQNDKRLADYGIFFNTTFWLLYSTSQMLNIFVKDLNSRTKSYTVSSRETVLGLKKMIEARIQVVVNEQRLTYQDKELEDGKTLAYYKIRNNDTVYLLLRLRGGHWNGMENELELQ